jgi:hypothetical protein
LGLRLAQKAAFAAVLAAALPCASANAATITATAKAKVVKPLALESRRNLDLGTIILGPGVWSGTTVKLARTGVLTCGGNVTCSGATQVAQYNVSGSNGETVVITVPNVTLVNQLNSSKTLTLVPDKPPPITLTNSGNPGTTFSIGGSVTVSSTTLGGNYVGTFNVTADYQ